VSVIAFALNFAAYSAEIFRAGIQGLDRGQAEAGIAMGFGRLRTFWYITLPQTIQRVLPVYKGGAEPVCLLGRQAAWPAGRMSALAGFLEPGESIEEACAREVKEEAGLTVIDAVYHSSQPWPFPSQLMIGLIAEVSDDQARPDQTELESVAWLTRAEARAVLAGAHPTIQAPPPFAIAHSLIKAWAEEA
jgi:NAD+ diphosphatase